LPNPRVSGIVGVTARAPRIRNIVATTCALSLVASAFPLTALSKPPAAAKKKVKAAHVRVETAKLRRGPSTDQRTVSLLDEGRVARVLERRNGWLLLRLQSGTEGWVRADLMKVSRRPVRLAVATPPSAKKKLFSSSSSSAAAARTKLAKAAALKEKQAKLAAAAKAKATPRVAKKPAPAVVAKNAKKTTVAKVTASAKKIAVAAKPVTVKPVTLAKKSAATKKPVLPIVAASVSRERFVRGSRLRSAQLRIVSVDTDEAAPAAPAAATGTAPALDEDQLVVVPPDGDGARTAAEKAEVGDTVIIASSDASQPPVRLHIAPPPLPGAAPRISRGDRIVRTALTYRGARYRRGATGRYGAFDCSGFTLYLFKKAGETLPRTAAQQFKHGQVVPKAQLRPGDLVFFRNTYKRGVSHVGVYVGNGDFVHAAGTSRGVRVDNLSGAYYRRHWAGARRPASRPAN